MPEKGNLAAKLAQFGEHWSPRTAAQLNTYDVMVVKIKGEFVSHKHDDTDDFFLVLAGRLIIRLPDGEVVLEPGELSVVPRGLEHQPFAFALAGSAPTLREAFKQEKVLLREQPALVIPLCGEVGG